MFPPLFEIHDLAKIIVYYIPVAQLTKWIKVSFKTQQLATAQILIRLSGLLTYELFLFFQKHAGLAFLFSCYSHQKIMDWLSKNQNVQYNLMSNNLFPLYWKNYAIDVENCSFWRDLLCNQNTHMLKHALQQQNAKKFENKLLKNIQSKRFEYVRWTAPMILYLAKLSSEMVDALCLRFETRPFSIDDRSCLDVLHQHHILDQSKSCEYFLRATDRLTIVIMFQTDYPLHKTHSPNLLKHNCQYHKLKEDHVAQLLKPLWFSNKKYASNFNDIVFQAFDPNGDCFRSLFESQVQFVEQAIERKSTKALKWAVGKLVLSTEDAVDCFALLINHMRTATKRIASFIEHWPDIARNFLDKLHVIMFDTHSCVIWNALRKHNMIDWRIFEIWKNPQWREFAHSPTCFVDLVWQDTPTFHKRHVFLFQESINQRNATASVLMAKAKCRFDAADAGSVCVAVV